MLATDENWISKSLEYSSEIPPGAWIPGDYNFPLYNGIEGDRLRIEGRGNGRTMRGMWGGTPPIFEGVE